MGTDVPTSYPLVITKHNLNQLTTLNVRHSIPILHKCEQDRRGKRRNFVALCCKYGISRITKEAGFFIDMCA